MRVILVDDEPLALAYLEKLLAEIGELSIVGSYTNAYQATQSVILNRPDLVFLDIQLPETNGIELAEYFQSILPQVKIVFVTAFDEYAVKAFELNAVDYIMKPVQRKRLNETIRRVAHNEQAAVPASPQHAIRIGCFQTLHFYRYHHETSEKESIDVYWRTAKARELFSYLIQHRDQYVRKDILIDLFWPESDVQKGYAQLYAAVYQIRKMLSSLQLDSTIISVEKSYKLHLNDVKLDVDEWEKEWKELPDISVDTLPKYQKVLTAYSGDYLDEDGYLWAENERERLRVHFNDTVKKVIAFYIEQQNYPEAMSLCQHVQNQYPQSEDSYFLLMQVYAATGNHLLVTQEYDKLSRMLAAEYDIVVSEPIQHWYEAWKKSGGTM
ncbi:Two-component response regulator, SAPR family, consists of REC, wHTH and BTAD domains [Evansella caseinilytica]|uniref:Two-component response regulator, SAPR family, consists of REC, wHTH and BTAD domains n=1 Tax=Evansella caseinilytica TaxID=1503961 RepID=A0A1H3Q5M1_9BACI|nr:response regulator [Evansella caseinilytica]SDZ08560.1 Two-component response regulator, SAPR family, consists of REC, wHTH and BTAD domains [Evansella caseinilytica]